ncbi:MAG: cyclopropane-fatty-acyl-phospholipid synthase family protein [Pseudomonadota bacterium]
MTTDVLQPATPTRLDTLAKKLLLSRLQRVTHGCLTIDEGGHKQVMGQTDAELQALITVHHPQFYSDVAFGGSIGAGEAYIRGDWTSPAPDLVVRLLLQNRDVLASVDSGWAWIAKSAQLALHWLNRNTRKGSRKNIAAHYDLGNEFYQLWLDERMMYSSAFFESEESSLGEAATAKLQRICDKLELKPGDHVIEIGSGWGGFAIFAAQNYGCRVTTTTISKEQFAMAEARIAAAGLQDQITLLQKDYRELEGQYDKLVSIEMIEAVGHQYHNNFFSKCCQLLKPDGLMLLQAITIADQRYGRYKRGVDFIRRYIFPGGCLTSVTDMCRVMTRRTDLRTVDIEDIGLHYAKTLRCWRDRFFAHIDTVRSQGYSDDFIRMWDFYLSFCEGAFLERAIGDVQMLIMRPHARFGAIPE